MKWWCLCNVSLDAGHPVDAWRAHGDHEAEVWGRQKAYESDAAACPPGFASGELKVEGRQRGKRPIRSSRHRRRLRRNGPPQQLPIWPGESKLSHKQDSHTFASYLNIWMSPRVSWAYSHRLCVFKTNRIHPKPWVWSKILSFWWEKLEFFLSSHERFIFFVKTLQNLF